MGADMSGTESKRYCYRCGAEVEKEASYCRKCGFYMGAVRNDAPKQYIDCRKTKFAIYISEIQSETGGIVKYFFEDANKYAEIVLEPGIVSGTEKVATISYTNVDGRDVKEIRRLKIIVGEAPTPNPYARTKGRKKSKHPRIKKSVKIEMKHIVAVGLLFVIVALYVTISRELNTSETESFKNSQNYVTSGVDENDPSYDDLENALPHSDIRFYYQNLNPSLKDDFLCLYHGVVGFEDSISLPYPVTENEATLLVTILGYECPELFQYDHTGEYSVTTINGIITEISLNYTMSESEYQTALKKCEDKIEQILKATGSYSEEEKEKYVYDYLTDLVSYSINSSYCENAYGALINHRAKCDGITLAMKWILEELDIPTLVVTGKQASDACGHAWNCVKIGNGYYDVDLTNDLQNSNRLMKLYGAYNVSRSWMACQYPVSNILRDNFSLPAGNSMKNSYHYENGSFIPSGSYSSTQIYDLIDDAGCSEGEGLIQFESPGDYNRFMNNYDTYFDEWYYDNNYGGSYEICSIKELNTVGFIMDMY